MMCQAPPPISEDEMRDCRSDPAKMHAFRKKGFQQNLQKSFGYNCH